MKNKRFLKIMSFILSISTLASPLDFNSCCAKAQSKSALSKGAKIGIGIAAGALGLGVAVAVGALIYANRGHKEESITDSGDQGKQSGDAYEGRNCWEVLSDKISGDVALKSWVEECYPRLKQELSKVNLVRSGGVELTVGFVPKAPKCIGNFFNLHTNDPEDTDQKLRIIGKQLAVYKGQFDADSSAEKMPPDLVISIGDRTIIDTRPKDMQAGPETAAAIKADLRSRGEALRDHINPETHENFANNWEQLCYLLGSEENIHWVEENYPEWKDRLTGVFFEDCGRHYEDILDDAGKNASEYESFALMSIAYSLLLAKAEDYDASNEENNELIEGLPDISSCKKVSESKTEDELLRRVRVFNEDILVCALTRFDRLSAQDDLSLKDKKIGFLNAGDPYQPCGFLPNHGSALEEYLSMNTTLARDLSHKAFRMGHPDCLKGGFYTTLEAFRPIVGGVKRNEKTGAWEHKYKCATVGEAMSWICGPKRDFYHERGIMSKNVRLIRPLGGVIWGDPRNNVSNFATGSDGLYSKRFCVLSIAGLEDRSGQLIKNEKIRAVWKEITKQQCRFVLHAFIKEGVQVPFLCAFGAGCFGGSATIVAECFRELLIDEGYADYFDRVVFPIRYGRDSLNGGKPNIDAFQTQFKRTTIPAQ